MQEPSTLHFSLAEFTNTSHEEFTASNLTYVKGHFVAIFATMCVLEFIRGIYGMPIKITSGYRCPELNRAVRGAADSDHMYGLAADICPSVPRISVMFTKYMQPLKLAVTKAYECGLIRYYEFHDNYIHISLPRY